MFISSEYDDVDDNDDDDDTVSDVSEDSAEYDLSQDAPKRLILACTRCVHGYECSQLRAVSALMEATVYGCPWDMR